MQYSNDERFRKFIIRKVRSNQGYIQQWQVAYPGDPFDKPKLLRFQEFETALAVAIYGIGYIERNGWNQFEERILGAGERSV